MNLEIESCEFFRLREIFLRIKFNKKILPSQVSQERLSVVAILSIEYDIAENKPCVWEIGFRKTHNGKFSTYSHILLISCPMRK